jgi:hypothetical protein
MKNRSTTFYAIKYGLCQFARVTYVEQWVKSLSLEVNLNNILKSSSYCTENTVAPLQR